MTKVYNRKDSIKHFVAVYGSLRLGMVNEPINNRAGAVWQCQGKTVNNHDLYEYGGRYFPCVSLKHNNAEKQIVVDVFEVNETGLEGNYDVLEGYPSFYNRTQIPIQMADGQILSAWIYHIDDEQEILVESGDWVEYKTRNNKEGLNGNINTESTTYNTP
jgi:gamma-glutamylaminecyclotransferase